MSPEQIALRTAGVQKETLTSEGRKRRNTAKSTTIAIVGLGYVGLPLAIRTAQKGYKVIGFDIDDVKVVQLGRREANFLDEEEADAFRGAENLTITSKASDISDADTFIVCVPTPVRDDHSPDLRPLQGASRIVGAHLSRDALVVIESTVNPNACEGVVLPILEEASGLSREEFHFAHCPERINPGDSRWSVCTIPRVVGGRTPECLTLACELYESLVEAAIVPMDSIKEAEAVKMVENSFRDVNIAFVNELAMAFDRAGIDLVNVLKGAGTKPFAFMPHYPGCGVGGHCIPVDPYYLIEYGRERGFEHRFLQTARRINDAMPRYTVHLLEEALHGQDLPLKGTEVALLGLAYKRDVPDLRESPSLTIRDALLGAGARVRTFDPHILGESTEKSLAAALEGAAAVIVATDHAPFRALTNEQFKKYGIKVVVDGRNCLDKDSFQKSGIEYRGIGRG